MTHIIIHGGVLSSLFSDKITAWEKCNYHPNLLTRNTVTHYDSIWKFVVANVNLNATSSIGSTALDLALEQRNNDRVCELLYAAGVPFTRYALTIGTIWTHDSLWMIIFKYLTVKRRPMWSDEALSKFKENDPENCLSIYRNGGPRLDQYCRLLYSFAKIRQAIEKARNEKKRE